MAQRTYGTPVGVTFTSLGTVTTGNACQSASITLSGHYDYLLRVQAARGTGTVTGGVDFFVAPVKTAGTYVDGASGSDSSFTVANRINAVYVGTLQVRASNTDSFETSLLAWLQYIPPGCALIAVNNSGGTMNGSVLVEVVPVTLGP